MNDKAAINEALKTWDGPLGLPRFEAITDADYEPAIMAGFDEDIAIHDAVADNPEPPTFENTIEPLERSETLLNKAAALFYTKASNHTNDAIQATERKLAPLFARHSATIARNEALFQRIDALWQDRSELGLTGEQLEVLERYHRQFVLMGAALKGAAQKRLFEVNERLASLGTAFGQNVLKDEADWFLPLDEAKDLDGLPQSLIEAMAAAAKDHGDGHSHIITLARSIIVPFLTFSTRRDLRQKAFSAWIARGENGGATDNREIIAETLQLRAERAQLLGYESFADLKLEKTMAKTPQAVDELLSVTWDKAKTKADVEADEITGIMAELGDNHALEASDWRFYAEKIRARRFDYTDDEVKPYFKLESMIAAAFDVAHRLFGLAFKEIKDVPLHHADARVWQVFNDQGENQAVFIADYFARPSKRSGAWMSAIQYQSKLTGKTPIITNTMNFAKPPEGSDAFLSFDDARTLFHEFGHALHGMLSNVTYPSVSGTSVSRDFVELPSQLYEHWLTVPEVLDRFARHHETGEPMPKELVDKILAARTFGSGFDTVEYASSALVDMAYHKQSDAPQNPQAFEQNLLSRLKMPETIVMRHRSPHFLHIFAGDGYAAGYYAYLWSEVLDADAFRAFEEVDNPFDPDIARKLRDHIYSTGGSVKPEEAYLAFRGKMPSPDAMLEGRGLN